MNNPNKKFYIILILCIIIVVAFWIFSLKMNIQNGQQNNDGKDGFSFAELRQEIAEIINKSPLGKKDNQPSPDELKQLTDKLAQEIKDRETADWQTFQNTQYNYEVKYPSDLIVDDENLDKVIIGSPAMPHLIIQAYPADYNNTDFDSLVQKTLYEESGGLLTGDDLTWSGWVHQEIFDQYAIDVEFTNVAGGYDGKVIYTFVPRQDYFYKIAATQGYKEMTQPEFQSQIINSFKFIDKTTNICTSLCGQEGYLNGRCGYSNCNTEEKLIDPAISGNMDKVQEQCAPDPKTEPPLPGVWVCCCK